MQTMPVGLWFPALLLLLSHDGTGQKTEARLEPGAFRGSDQYDFAIVVPASGRECFWHFAHQSGNFYLTYMVQWVTGIASNHQLFATVTAPDGSLMASSSNTLGQIHFVTEVTGFYKMCLGNYNNNFGGMRVFLSFGVFYEGFEEARKETEEGYRILNSTLSNIEESTKKLQGHIYQMWRLYNFARMRRGADHYLLLSNFNYVTWWSVAQSAVIVLAGFLQLFFLKRLFHTDTKRLRC
ncbi:transmembrane emp24 domain-containing protein 6-like isoform X1 [Hypomesus transpacificus]|uniref:transmembrane emp24 domain-containing protein 6-like isoform X1 n=1 Tax=Hypomesus transpacificus TaxID=137520 RepID=UPI001F07A132|nr:transmembrane emp24 domain-containing protein 6-like isoform X1 [Hypomesus transpacificus]